MIKVYCNNKDCKNRKGGEIMNYVRCNVDTYFFGTKCNLCDCKMFPPEIDWSKVKFKQKLIDLTDPQDNSL